MFNTYFSCMKEKAYITVKNITITSRSKPDCPKFEILKIRPGILEPQPQEPNRNKGQSPPPPPPPAPTRALTNCFFL